MRLLFLGDVVGRPGRNAVTDHLPALRERWALDFVAINGENAAGGFGFTETIYNEFVDACKGAVRAYADIDHSVPMLEAMLVGCIAQRMPNTKLAWNSARQTFGNKDADAFIRPFIRPGWGGWEYK